MCDVGRNVLRPLFGGVEGDDANRIFVLALKQIEDHGFQIGSFHIGFASGAAVLAKVIDNEVNVPILVLRHDRGRPAGLTH